MSKIIRTRLMEALKTDSDFNAFCVDEFRGVYRRFTAGMDLPAKVNLLFETEGAEVVGGRLNNWLDTSMSQQESEDKLPSPGVPYVSSNVLPLASSPPAESENIYQPVPQSATSLYKWCWQLVHWLRLIIYVELRAVRIDWEAPLFKTAASWPPSSLERDKRLHHMTTASQTSLEYLTLNELWSIIEDKDTWPLFEPYFPPYCNESSRMDEIMAIVDRVMNFRETHPQDETRLGLFLRDVELGLRRFCIRYTYPKFTGKRDSLTEYMHSVWPNFYSGVELRCIDQSWLYASGRYKLQPIMNASIDIMTHKSYKKDSLEGIIYALSFRPAVGNRLDAYRLLENTKSLHKDIIHFFMFDVLAVTIPAIHGVEKTSNLIFEFLSFAQRLSRDSGFGNGVTDVPKTRRREWPEYVLWPNHMLDLFYSEMKELVIDLS